MSTSHPLDSDNLARLVTFDLGQEVSAEEVRTYLLSGKYPGRLSTDERLDMAATLLKELASA